MRFKDLVKGGGRRPAPSREVQGTSRRLSDLVRKPGPPQVQEGASLEGRPQESPGVASKDASSQLTAEEAFRRAEATAARILQAAKTQAPPSLTEAEDAVEGLLRALEKGDALLVPFFSPGSPDPSPAREAVHVAILALKIGLELGYAPDELRRLGLVALLHDVGMARLPEAFLHRKGPLSKEERALLERHPEEGARLLDRVGPPWLAEVVRQVHERMDGSGYPHRLKGAEIHEHAQVVGLADLYESLVHPRPFRRRLDPVAALKEILHKERTAFPDRILKALIRALSAFPVGSLVRLNTGEIGRVIAKNPTFPLRPVVEVLARQGKRLEDPVVIDLAQRPLLHIQGSVVEEDLP